MKRIEFVILVNDDVDIPQSTLDNTKEFIQQSYDTHCNIFKFDLPDWLYDVQRANGLYVDSEGYEREEYEQEIPF